MEGSIVQSINLFIYFARSVDDFESDVNDSEALSEDECFFSADLQVARGPKYAVFATRDIEIGERITCDYDALLEDDVELDGVTLTCECGESSCRGEIRF